MTDFAKTYGETLETPLGGKEEARKVDAAGAFDTGFKGANDKIPGLGDELDS